MFYSLILKEAVTTEAFAPGHKLEMLMKYHLSRATEVVEAKCDSWQKTHGALAAIPDGRLQFLVICGHGSMTTINLGGGAPEGTMILHIDDIATHFAELPKKMAPGGFVMLNSCSTGSYMFNAHGAQDNMAMVFAKLLAGCGVRVIAPADTAYTFCIFQAADGWKFLLNDAKCKNIVTCIGPDGKDDTAAIAYADPAYHRICAAFPGMGRWWRTPDALESAADQKNEGLFNDLISFLAPEQMLDGREADHLAAGMPTAGAKDYRPISLVLRLIIAAAWCAPHIQRWADTIDIKFAEAVRSAMAAYADSPLAKSVAVDAARELRYKQCLGGTRARA